VRQFIAAFDFALKVRLAVVAGLLAAGKKAKRKAKAAILAALQIETQESGSKA